MHKRILEKFDVQKGIFDVIIITYEHNLHSDLGNHN